MHNKFNIQEKKQIIFLIVLGILMILIGVVPYKVMRLNNSNTDMALGVITGLGGAFLGMGLVSFIRLKVLSPEKLKEIEIEKRDERNEWIKGRVYKVCYLIDVIMLILMALAFLILNYRLPAFVCIGAMYVQGVVAFIVSRYYRKNM